MKNLRFILLSLFVVLVSIDKSHGQLSSYDAHYSYTSFDEDFGGDSIDPVLWEANSYMRDIGLLIDSSATIDVTDGKLKLTMIECPNCQTSRNGTVYYGEFAGGEIHSKRDFTYGIFECKAKFAELSGAWPAFWTIGGDGLTCPQGGYADEIDIAEYFCGGSTNRMEHNIHHYYREANCEKNSKKVDHVTYLYNVNNSYHTFKCIWTPDKIEYYIDEQLKHTVTNNDQICVESGRKWFPTFPQRIILSQQVLDPHEYPGVITPQTSYFDWVTVKEFFEPPVITISSDVICSNETATLNVDSKATNISWELSPTYLFSGSTDGTGKTASISAASSRSGQGKITYSFYMPDGEDFSIEKTFCVGNPQLSIIHMDFTNGVGDNGYFCTSHSGNEFDLSYYNNFACCDNYQVKLTHLNGTVVDEFYTSSGMGDLDYSNLNEGYYLFYARGHNDCGWGAWCDTEIEYVDCSQMMLMISPNPASGEVSLSIEPNAAEESITLKSAATNIAFDDAVEWQIEVYSAMQNLKAKQTKIRSNSTKINTQSWKEGVYTVRAKYKDQILTGKLVVRK